MNRLNRDTVIAIILMVFCGIFFWASFSIREPDYGVLPPSAWPRVVLVALSVLTVLYFVQSIRRTRTFDDSSSTAGKGLKHWFSIWQNPIWCFVLFFGYVASLPVLGMLIGGVTFVFLLQCVLGGWSPRNLVVHALVALATVGGMWCIFTFGLGVLLPPGEIFNPFR
ncbi:MAG TPA: tripartite tricarboxylate transporter TctB family protein [Gammaproteobacteria bacterium]|jgi:hypothetical protein|nr:tripartite tricarboxylate transporter TctB family protein [Gammaproteobacteria bacterium]PHS09050.1 MAG: hypothetical protein COA89_02995 [Acidithiobacillus sp.]RTZ65789.1 MAG: hypothetical protein DSZ34_02760 [Gammaproteobacteria bacterium]HAD36228.1 hypothetical protein [Gammaproteobacteria bacterium]HAN60747.1 hypothetical protein [Gammaproteobacteria bacterium]